MVLKETSGEIRFIKLTGRWGMGEQGVAEVKFYSVKSHNFPFVFTMKGKEIRF